MSDSDSTVILNEVILTELRETRQELKGIGGQVQEIKIQNLGILNKIDYLEKEIDEEDNGLKDRVKVLYDSYSFRRKMYKMCFGIFTIGATICGLIIAGIKK